MRDLPCFHDAPWSSGSAPAFIQGERSCTYDQLRASIQLREILLRRSGVLPGQVLMAPDTPTWNLVLTQHALARIGAVLFPVREGSDPSLLDALIAQAGVEWRWDDSAERPLSTGKSRTPDVETGDASLAFLIKTSGSTGRPKIAMLTQTNVLASALNANEVLGLGAGDLWLACLRSSHVGGLSIAYRCALAGATLLLHDGFLAERVAGDLERLPVTHLSLVPPMLARLLELGCRPPASLRVLMIGGQALSLSLAQRALDTGWPLYVSYGMTETGSQIATKGPLCGRIDETSVAGCPMPDLDLDLSHCPAHPARLRIRGPVVMAGYANPERRPGDGLDEGWFETADLACLSPEGELRILGRADDVRVIGGTNVSRARIENRLASVPGIGDVLIVDLPDPVWGHRLIAVHSGDLALSELDAWCVEHLSGPERPRAFMRLAHFPLLDSGKFDRAAIVAQVKAADG